MSKLAGMRKQVAKIKSKIKKPAIIATLPDRRVEIRPSDLLDYFFEAIRLGDIPKDHELYPIFQEAQEDEDQGQIFECMRKLAQGIEPVPGGDDLFLPRGKQAESILKSVKRINFWYGSVRSSKTIMSLIVWLWRCLHGPKGRRMMIANTLETLELNCLDPLRELLPAVFSFTPGWKHCFIFGRKVRLRGADDIGMEKKFRGPTLVDAYCDEVTTWAKQVFKMLMTRLDKTGSMAFLTTNPDQPLNYLKTDYLDREAELDLQSWHFTLDDNPGLTEEYKANLIRENPPGTVYYLRFILGLWVAAEGRVYRFFTNEPKDGYVIDELPDDLTSWMVAADYGQQHYTVYVLAGYSPFLARWVAVKEFYTKDKTNATYSEEFKREILEYNGGIVPIEINIDSGGGGLSLIKQFRNDYPTLSVNGATKKDVAKEIQELSTALFTHKICLYSKGCPRGITEMMSYLWNEKAGLLGREEPIKQNDDFCDAFRYLYQLCMRYS